MTLLAVLGTLAAIGIIIEGKPAVRKFRSSNIHNCIIAVLKTLIAGDVFTSIWECHFCLVKSNFTHSSVSLSTASAQFPRSSWYANVRIQRFQSLDFFKLQATLQEEGDASPRVTLSCQSRWKTDKSTVTRPNWENCQSPLFSETVEDVPSKMSSASIWNTSNDCDASRYFIAWATRGGTLAISGDVLCLSIIAPQKCALRLHPSTFVRG